MINCDEGLAIETLAFEESFYSVKMSSSTHLIEPNLFDNSKDMGHHTCFGATDLEFPLNKFQLVHERF